MSLMRGNDPSQRTDADRFAVGESGAQACLARESSEKNDRRQPHVLVLVHQIRERACVEVCRGHVRILLKPRQRRGIIAGEAKGSIRENALAVDEVAEYLLTLHLPGSFDAPALLSGKDRNDAVVSRSCSPSTASASGSLTRPM